jgi:hypothetical protein
MRQVIYTFCAALLMALTYTAMPKSASAEPTVPDMQKVTGGLLQKVQYGGGYRHDDDDDDAPPPPRYYDDPPRPSYYGDYTPPPPPPPPVSYEQYDAPPVHTYYYHRYTPHYYTWRRRLDPGWSTDGRPQFRSDRFTAPYCEDCIDTCRGNNECPQRCWGWKHYCRRFY